MPRPAHSTSRTLSAQSEPIDICIAAGRNDHARSGLAEFSRQLTSHIVHRSHPRVRFHYQAQAGLEFDQYLAQELAEFAERITPLAPRPRPWSRNNVRGRIRLWHSLNHYIELRPPRSAASLVTLHDLNYRYGSDAKRKRRGHRRIARTIACHDRVASISKHTAQDLQSDFRRPSDMIHNGATSLLGHPQRTPEHAPAPGFVLHISRMSPEKNTRSMFELARDWPEQTFVFAGPRNSHTEELARNIAREQVSNASLLYDISEAEKAWLYGNAGAFLFPSLCEGFGLPVIEAMHFGLPVCVSNLTSLPEVAGAGAFYVEQFDPETMRRAVVAALESAGSEGERADRMRHAAHFSWARAASEYCAIYNELLGEHAFEVD